MAKSSRRRNLKNVFSRYTRLSLALLEDRSMPSIAGTVFQDYNANGVMDLNTVIANSGQGTTPAAVDRGLAGINVTAYDASNAVAATATTDASGHYTLTVPVSGAYRVEFTNLPPGVYFGPQGTSSGSAIQFVNSGSVNNVSLAVVRPEDFSPNNPTLVTSQYVVGGNAKYDLNPGSTVIVSFPYSSGSVDSDPNRTNHQQGIHELNVRQADVGATWGLAYDANTNKLYASAYMKRTTGFGVGGPGAIYSMGTSGSTANLYADLNALFPAEMPAGNLNALYTDINGNPVPFRTQITSFDYWFRDGLTSFTDQDGAVRELGWDAVGKLALGGLDSNDDGSRIYTIALADRRLYSLPTSGPIDATTVTRFSLPVPATVTGITATNPLGDLRPFAVEVHRGIVYIGAVNSAESTQDAADLRAYVFAFDPATGTFVDATRKLTTTDAVFEFALNYPRGKIHIGNDPNPNFPGGVSPPDPAEWNAWSPVHQSVQQQPFALGRSGYPQPMLTGLSFDADGNLVLGLRDRSGDQFGRNVPIDPARPDDFSPFSMTAGDVLRAFINTPQNLDVVQANSAAPFAGWTLENNGRGPNGEGTAPAGTGQGPGNGEFYFDDDFPRDPTTNPLGVTTENDEVSMGGVLQIPGFNHTIASAFDPVRLIGAINGGGFRWYDNLTGAVLKTYELYVTPSNASTSTFAKGNGLGDLVAVTQAPPIEIGNFVWNDANRNGVQDAGEAGLANVVIDLFTAGNNGVFGDGDDVKLASATTDTSGNYIFSSGIGTSSASRLYGLGLKANSDYQLRVSRTQAALSGRGFTVQAADASFNGTQRDSNVDDLGIATVHTSLVGRSDHSFDVGVSLLPNLAIGDFVWNDLNNDGRRQQNEPGVDNVTVNLYLGSSITPLSSQTTANGGRYLFTGLGSGNYVVEIVAPAGFVSSTGQSGSLSGPFEPGATDNENDADHGTNQSNGRIRSSVVLLDNAGSTTNPDSHQGEANTANLRVDFGLIRPLSIGNLVWNDINNDGVRQSNEPGLGGVTLTLRTDLGAFVASTVTNSAGGYLFTTLDPGNYRVEVVRSSLPSAAFISSTGANNISAGPFEPASGTSVDSTDYGSNFGSVVRGPVVVLTYGTQPLGEAATEGGIVDTATDANSNRRQDFGFFRTLSLGNLVWFDKDNDGIFNNGELGAGGVVVHLFNVRGDRLTTTTTAADGSYLFENLFPDTYRVVIEPPANYTSSTGVNGSTTGPFEPAPSNNNDNEDKGTVDALTITSSPVTLDVAGSQMNPSLGGLGNLTVDFGLVETRIVVPPPPPPPASPPASVSGFVYRDISTTDGIREPALGERGIGGVVITLVGVTVDGPVNRTAYTDINGFYQFLNLPAGNYVITETQPQGFYDALDTPGSLSGTSPSNDVLTVTLVEGDNGVEYNFGEVPPAAVFGYVYEDLNRNRLFDQGEPGIPNVTITLSGIAFFNTPLERPITAADSLGGLVVRTDAFGRWEYPFLPAGLYTITEAQPQGFIDFFESDQSPRVRPLTIGNDIFSVVRLDYSEIRGPLNYGEFRTNDNTKKNFLGSSSGSLDPSVTPPINTLPTDVPLDPAFTVNTGTPAIPAFVVTAAGPGHSPLVRVFDYSTAVERFRFYAYEKEYSGGVRVATGDINGDGIPDIITATGLGGGPRVRAFNGVDGAVLRDFFAYEPEFRGGVFVAAADVNGDGKDEIITGTEQGGGPRVTVFDAVSNARIQDFFAFDSGQRGGVRVAAADFNGDNKADLVTTAGRGNQTRVRIFDAVTHATLADYTPYDVKFTGGVYIAAGDVNGDGIADVVTGADVGGGPHVQVFNGLTATSLYSFFADDVNYRGGIRLALQNVDGDAKQEIVTGTGPQSAARIRLWKDGALTPIEEFYAFDTTYTGGVYVG